MRVALRQILKGDLSSIRRNTMKGLEDREFVGGNGDLTTLGWEQAVSIIPLQEQCGHLGIDYERLEELDFRGAPEYAAWQYFCANGYKGAFCEGGPILLLIRAAALDVFAKLNPFNSRDDACTRFTEAQLTIHENNTEDILDAVSNSTPRQIAKGFKEIYAKSFVQETYRGLSVEIISALFSSIGTETLTRITSAIMEDPYRYRSGWPDLTMTNGDQMLWAEVKTTDKLHMSQISTLHRMKSILPGEIRVCHLR